MSESIFIFQVRTSYRFIWGSNLFRTRKPPQCSTYHREINKGMQMRCRVKQRKQGVIILKRISIWVLVVLLFSQTQCSAKIYEKADSFYGTRTVSSEYKKSAFLSENNYGTNQRRFVFSKIFPAGGNPESYELMFSVIYRTIQPFTYHKTADVKVGSQIMSMPLKKSEWMHALNSSEDRIELYIDRSRDNWTTFLLGTYIIPPEILKAFMEVPAGTKILIRTEWSWDGEKNIDTFEVPDAVLKEWRQVANTK